MSPLFFASIASSVVTSPPMIHGSASAVRPQPSVAVARPGASTETVDRHSAYTSTSTAVPDWMDTMPDWVATATPGAVRPESPPTSATATAAPTTAKPPARVSYTVQPGDTIWAIAHRLNSTTQAILTANPDIVPEYLAVGQVLSIPQPGAELPQAEGPQYTVQVGDTVWAIAQSFNVSTQAILDANPGTVPEKLAVNQTLHIPLNGSAATAPPVLETSPPEPEFSPSGDHASAPSAEWPPSDQPAQPLPSTPSIPLPSSHQIVPFDADQRMVLGLITLVGLGFTAVGWYVWQQRTALAMSFAKAGAKPESEVNECQIGTALEVATPPWLEEPDTEDIDVESGLGRSSPASPQLSPQRLPQFSLQVKSIIGGIAGTLPLPSPTWVAHLAPAQQAEQSRQESLESHWSDPVQSVLDDPPSTLPQHLIVGGIVFCMMFGTWAWLGKIEEIGRAQGQLTPQGEVYEVQFPEAGTIIRLAVQEGETVKQGQILFELDTQLADSEVKRLQELLDAYQLELVQKQHLIADLQQESETVMLITQTDLEAQRAAIHRIESNSTTTETVISQLEQDEAAHQERLGRLESLVNEGALPREQLFQLEQAIRERQRSIVQTQGDLYTNLAQISELQAEMAQKRAEGQRQRLRTQQQLQQVQADVAALQAKMVETQNLLDQANVTLSQRYLYAPVDGVVSSLQVKNIGEVVQPGQTIAEIIPDDSPLVLSAVLPSQEAGFVKQGMAAQIKFDAYPFQDFGIVPGHVQSISPNTELDERLGPVYRVEIKLDRDFLKDSEHRIQFKPGSTASAEIIIRKRRIADILLDPIKQLSRDGLSL